MHFVPFLKTYSLDNNFMDFSTFRSRDIASIIFFFLHIFISFIIWNNVEERSSDKKLDENNGEKRQEEEIPLPNTS